MSDPSNNQKTTIKFHPAQYEAYHSDKLYTAAIAGKRSGKTFCGAFWALKKITEMPEGTGLIAAPTHKHLQQAALDTFFKLFPEYWKHYRKGDSTLELPTGGRVYLRSTDDPLALEGLTLDWIWLDEAGMMKRDVWRICRARVSTTKGQIFITTTPYNMGWLYQDFFLPWKEGEDDDLAVYRWKTLENPVFDTTEGAMYIEKERLRLREEEFAREYEGEFRKMEGLIWDVPRTSIIEHDKTIEKVLSFPDQVVAGIDWGFNNPAAVVVGVVKDAVFYIVDEWKEPEKTTAEILEICQAFRKKYKVAIWYPDPAEPDRIEEMRRGGFRIGKVNKDVPTGLSHVNALLREERLLITENCQLLLDEMEQYHYPPGVDGKPLREEPVKLNDHLCDALRYMCMGYRPPDPYMQRVRLMQNLGKRKKKDQYL